LAVWGQHGTSPGSFAANLWSLDWADGTKTAIAGTLPTVLDTGAHASYVTHIIHGQVIAEMTGAYYVSPCVDGQAEAYGVELRYDPPPAP
jgi:hypothetical protein